MKKLLIIVCVMLMVVVSVSVGVFAVQAETDQERLDRLGKQIEAYQNEVKRLQSQSTTLANQIAQFDTQIKLTELKISQTEDKIDQLAGRIDQLELSLTSLTNAFEERALLTYKMSRFSTPYFLLISSSDLSSAVSNMHYLKIIQDADRNLLDRLENAQVTYMEEKDAQEELQDELEGQKKNLDSQKSGKAYLLAQTKNDEKKYQQLLASSRSEFEAIQAIVAGRGSEEEAGAVAQGAKIASVIQGPSCNSSGSHVHFIVARSGTTLNPFEHLKSGVGFENCSGSSCGSSDGDPFNPTGAWEWPIASSVKYTQGYGSTWATRNTWVGRIYQFHNGIDINSTTSPDIKAVRAGKLYRGSYTGVNGCRLRYVRLDHDDTDLETFYLHINY
jgi:peptidoglycan hydrolase CwlO-like protein